jgi:hypothetical protein
MTLATRLLGSAVGLCVAVGAQAADLPVERAAPVEYVRVCTAVGEGFFYIPGTDTGCVSAAGSAPNASRSRPSTAGTTASAFSPEAG